MVFGSLYLLIISLFGNIFLTLDMNIMKTRIIQTMLIVIFGTAISQAQIGIRAGVNFADWSISGSNEQDEVVDADRTTFLIGLNIGLTLEFPISDRLSLQPELHFIQKGVNDKSKSSDPVQYESKVLMNYAEIALMAKYNLLDFGEKNSLYLGLSPYFGYGLSGEISYEDDEQSYEFKIIFDDQFNFFQRIDYGLGLGFGLHFGNAFLDARYNLGISNIIDSNGLVDSDLKIYNRGILIGLGYRF